jgi:hypothetical protein
MTSGARSRHRLQDRTDLVDDRLHAQQIFGGNVPDERSVKQPRTQLTEKFLLRLITLVVRFVGVDIWRENRLLG